MTKPPTILIFDSGVGGLSILLEVQKQLPQCHFSYACDNEAFPYGTKQQEELILRVDKVLKGLTRNLHPDIIVVACNTASTVALPKIRDHFAIPVVGVVPAIKPAAALSTSKTIGLLGTPGTVSRPYTQQLINDFASDCQVVRVGSSEMVEVAEQKLRGAPIDRQRLSQIMAPFFASSSLDTIVLACTHFPLLLDDLNAVLPRSINWVDSGEAIARRVASLLHQPALEKPAENNTFSCLMTAQQPANQQLFEQLKRFGCSDMKTLVI